MTKWFISHLLVFAVLGCPLWCSLGLCTSVQFYVDQCQKESCCGSRTAVETELGKASNTTRCCSRNRSPDSKEQKPCCPTEKEFCQGICGGAVLEKSCTWERPGDVLTLLSEATDGFKIVSIAYTAGECAKPAPISGTGNHGRFLRVLHKSFLS